MGYEYEVTAAPALRPVETRRKMKTWIRPAARMAFAAGCMIVALQATSGPVAAMTAAACQQLSADQLLVAVDQGVCTLDVLPSAGPAPQIADSGTTGEHDGDGPGGGGDPRGGGGSSGGGSGGDGSGSGGSGGDGSGGGGSGGGGSGGGSGGGDDDGGGDDSGGSGGGDDGGSGGDDGHDHDHNHGHGHGHGGHGHGGCGE